MEIIWHGYACFEFISGGYSLLLDPYRAGTLAGFPALDAEADEVLCSHGHDGHGATEAVRLRKRGAASPFAVESVQTWHDVMKGRLRGENIVRIISAEGLRIVHLGDLGSPLAPEPLERISGADLLLVPTGGILTIEPYAAYTLSRASGARRIVPMHYNVGGGSRRLRRVEEFTSLFEPGEVALSESNRLTLSAGEEPEALVTVLTPPWGRN